MDEGKDKIGVFFDAGIVGEMLGVAESRKINDEVAIVVGKKRDKLDPVGA